MITGKTSMLHAILGELERSSGDVQLKGEVSYAAQVSSVLCTLCSVLLLCIAPCSLLPSVRD